MNACPLCAAPHSLSQCPRWITPSVPDLDDAIVAHLAKRSIIAPTKADSVLAMARKLSLDPVRLIKGRLQDLRDRGLIEADESGKWGAPK